MNRNLKLVINNSIKKYEEKFFFEKSELKIILDLYAKMVSNGSWKDYGLNISNSQINYLGHHLNTILSNLRHTFGLYFIY